MPTPVCDYEGSDYRTRFWENQNRNYEDQVERLALRKLMPPTGKTLIEIGAGFGRLADEYKGYDKVVLFDYSRSLLREAQAQFGNDPRFIYVAGNWYQMPFVDGLFNTIVQIRTIHHAADVPQLFKQLTRIAHPSGDYILEFANKQNLKAILRYLLRQQKWSPFTPEPNEFVELNFNFQPAWMEQQLKAAQFTPTRKLTVSRFRFNLLKKLIPLNILVALDNMLQSTGALWQLSPSVFTHNNHPAHTQAAKAGQFFACPTCQTPLHPDETQVVIPCPNEACNLSWRAEANLYDFKEPVES